MEEQRKQDQNLSEDKDRLSELKFIVDGLEFYEPFKKFIALFEQDAIQADATWQNCIVEDLEGRKLFYQLRANKLSVVNVIRKIDELKYEVEGLVDSINEGIE